MGVSGVIGDIWVDCRPGANDEGYEAAEQFSRGSAPPVGSGTYAGSVGGYVHWIGAAGWGGASKEMIRRGMRVSIPIFLASHLLGNLVGHLLSWRHNHRFHSCLKRHP